MEDEEAGSCIVPDKSACEVRSELAVVGHVKVERGPTVY